MTNKTVEVDDILSGINQDIKEQKAVGKTASILMKQIRMEDGKRHN